MKRLSLDQRLDRLMDKVVASDRKMKKHGMGWLSAHVEARQALKDAVSAEIDRIRQVFLGVGDDQ